MSSDYAIGRELGRGSVSVVHLARQRRLNRMVAIKRLLVPGDELAFLRGAELTARLAHPNIGAIFDIIDDDGAPSIVMEYLAGGSLRGLVGRLSVPQLAGVMGDVLAGLGHAAAHGVVHRDLKPENLLLDGDGRVKIVDFSIAQDSGSSRTAPAGITLGTPRYMSPEQCRGEVLDERSDLYAVGCVAFELLTGHVPHAESGQPLELLARRVAEPAPRLVTVHPGAGPGLSAWVDRLLELDRTARYATAAAAWAALQDHVVRAHGADWRNLATLPRLVAAPIRFLTDEVPVVKPPSPAARPATPCPGCGALDNGGHDFCRSCGRYLRWADTGAVKPVEPAPPVPALPPASVRRAPPRPGRPAGPRRPRWRWIRRPDAIQALEQAWTQASVIATASSTGDLVDCTVFAPPQMTPGARVMVQVFAHHIQQASAVERVAREFDAASRKRGVHSLAEPVQDGAALAFELRVPGLRVQAPVQSLVWRGEPRAVQFDVAVPAKLRAPAVVIGTVIVRHDLVPLGQIGFKLEIVAAQDGPPRAPMPVGEQVIRYRRAFLSYASEDRGQVLDRAQMLRLLRIEYFHDLLSLEPGERWERELYRQIERSDLFLLFWSEHAQRSQWVRRETRHALSLCGADFAAPPQICPVIVRGPPVAKPWEELAHLHFNDALLYVRAGLGP